MAVRKALAAAATNDKTFFKFQGTTLEIPTGDNIPADAMIAFERRQFSIFVHDLLGDVQWRKINPSGTMTAGELNELMSAMTEAMGTSPGE